MQHIQGEPRQQRPLFPDSLDEYLSADTPVRVIDALLDALEMTPLGVPCWGKTGANAERGRAVLAYNLSPMIHELGVQRWLQMIEPERGRQKQRTLPGQGSCRPLRVFLHSLLGRFFYVRYFIFCVCSSD